ncbi:MAG: SDR family NAD(P)-dependent oxidoreductase [Burkholderiales bacterium]|nr:SDR family NAD(P)-dependent oxidoreductase [Burkholderiales bacterium]
MAHELKGKVAVITGATRKRGLGRAIALALARAGADVAVTGSSRDNASLTADEQKDGWRGLPDVVAEIEALGVRGCGAYMDVRKAEDVQRMVQEVVDKLGRIDILINNATYPRAADRVPVQELDDDLWRNIIDINLTGTMLCSKYVSRQMITQGEGGSIVSISSGAALKAPATFSAYAASKAGMHALMAALADELGEHGITANVIAPGFLDTARIDTLRDPAKWEKRLSTIPIKRPGTVEEVADLVRYLCGPSARWISGDVLLMTGGEVRRAAR